MHDLGLDLSLLALPELDVLTGKMDRVLNGTPDEAFNLGCFADALGVHAAVSCEKARRELQSAWAIERYLVARDV